MSRRGRSPVLLPAAVLALLGAALVWYVVHLDRARAAEERAGYRHRMRSVVAWLPEGAGAVARRVEQFRAALARGREATDELSLLTDLALSASGGLAEAERLLRRARDTTPPPEYEGFHRGLCEALAHLRSAEVELQAALAGDPAGPLSRAAHAAQAVRALSERLALALP